MSLFVRIFTNFRGAQIFRIDGGPFCGEARLDKEEDSTHDQDEFRILWYNAHADDDGNAGAGR